MLHMRGGLDRQPVFNARTRKNGRGNVAHQFQLPLRRMGQQGGHQVFQCDHANLQLHQFSVGQRRHPIGPARRGNRGSTIRAPSLVLPTRQRSLQPPCALHIFRWGVRHKLAFKKWQDKLSLCRVHVQVSEWRKVIGAQREARAAAGHGQGPQRRNAWRGRVQAGTWALTRHKVFWQATHRSCTFSRHYGQLAYISTAVQRGHWVEQTVI